VGGEQKLSFDPPPIHTFESGATCPLAPIDTSLVIHFANDNVCTMNTFSIVLLYLIIKYFKVSLIKTGLMFHKYHLLNQLQVFMRYKKIPR
jgi:hypothetical protein